jgi:hypothetical protein
VEGGGAALPRAFCMIFLSSYRIPNTHLLAATSLTNLVCVSLYLSPSLHTHAHKHTQPESKETTPPPPLFPVASSSFL